MFLPSLTSTSARLGKTSTKMVGRRGCTLPSTTNHRTWLMSKSLGERFWEKVNCTGTHQPHMASCCWEWTGSKNPDGYGRFNLGVAHGGKRERPHALSLSFGLGYMPAYVMHRCDNPACVRPSHLREGTHSENTQEAYDKNRQPLQKLSKDDLQDIRSRCARGELQKSIAKRYGITQSRVSQIKSRKT